MAAGLVLRDVVVTHALCGGMQGIFLRIVESVKRGFEIILRKGEFAHCGHVNTIKTVGVLDHRRIATRTHGGDDFGHGILYACVGAVVKCEALRECHIKIGVLCGQG